MKWSSLPDDLDRPSWKAKAAKTFLLSKLPNEDERPAENFRRKSHLPPENFFFNNKYNNLINLNLNWRFFIEVHRFWVL